MRILRRKFYAYKSKNRRKNTPDSAFPRTLLTITGDQILLVGILCVLQGRQLLWLLICCPAYSDERSTLIRNICSSWARYDIFSPFPTKQTLTFHANCMKCQSLFPGKKVACWYFSQHAKNYLLGASGLSFTPWSPALLFWLLGLLIFREI